MPLNYLQLLPQISEYARRTGQMRNLNAAKLEIALALLRSCGQRHAELHESLNACITARPGGDRCALLAHEPADSAFDPPAGSGGYILAASDGSQIIPGGHDALPLALVNTSRLTFLPGSGQAPQVVTFSRFMVDADGGIDLGEASEDFINLKRDVEEMRVLAEWENESGLPAIALGDGPLELFHQPRSEAAFSRAFSMYQSALEVLHAKGAIAAGYTDRPRAALAVKMLEYMQGDGRDIDLSGLEDLQLFGAFLAPGQRSAVFALWSSSSQRYKDDLALHFFYLNAGSVKFPSLARVEIPAWVAADALQVGLLHRALLEQCRLMGPRPYPYLLHRAHEAAEVSFDEKEKLIARLSQELVAQGLGASAASNKQSAKDLGSRRRLES